MFLASTYRPKGKGTNDCRHIATNPWVIFFKDNFTPIKQENPQFTREQIMSIIRVKWNSMDALGKSPYLRRAAEAKEQKKSQCKNVVPNKNFHK